MIISGTIEKGRDEYLKPHSNYYNVVDPIVVTNIRVSGDCVLYVVDIKVLLQAYYLGKMISMEQQLP